MKTAVVSLSIALALSAFGNVFLAYETAGNAQRAFYSIASYQQAHDESDMLRNYVMRLARGEPPKGAWVALDGQHAVNGPWFEAGPLMARFDGEKLVAICSVMHPLGDPCSKGH